MDEREMIQERMALNEKSKAILDRATREGNRELTAAEQAECDRMHERITAL